MVNVKLIALMIFILLIISGIFIVYYFTGKETVEEYKEIKTFDVNFLFKDNNKQVETGYVIYVDGVKLKEGSSTKENYILEKMPTNKSIVLLNKNINSQSYYLTKIDLFELSGIKRLDIPLESVGSVEMFTENKIENKDIKLAINTVGIVKNPIICLRWSSNIIRAYVKDFPIINIPENYYNKYDKCYELNLNLSNNVNYIYLRVDPFDILKDDYVNVLLIDRDYFSEDLTAIKSYYNGTDLYLKDYEFQLK